MAKKFFVVQEKGLFPGDEAVYSVGSTGPLANDNVGSYSRHSSAAEAEAARQHLIALHNYNSGK